MEFQSKAVVVTVSAEVKSKNDANGTPTGAKFVKCTVKHLDGVLAGKTFFANRTVVSKNRETGELKPKDPVVVGQEVIAHNRVQDGNMFTEISTASAVDNVEDIMALINANADQIAQDALSGQ